MFQRKILFEEKNRPIKNRPTYVKSDINQITDLSVATITIIKDTIDISKQIQKQTEMDINNINERTKEIINKMNKQLTDDIDQELTKANKHKLLFITQALTNLKQTNKKLMGLKTQNDVILDDQTLAVINNTITTNNTNIAKFEGKLYNQIEQYKINEIISDTLSDEDMTKLIPTKVKSLDEDVYFSKYQKYKNKYLKLLSK